MPNDDPFNSAPEPVAPVVPEIVVPDSDGGKAMATALADATAPLRDAITSLNTQLAASQRQNQIDASKSSVVPEQTQDEFSQAFYADPQGSIQGEFTRASAPLVATLADQIAEQNYSAERIRIDHVWGEGAFDAAIDAELRPIIDEAKQYNAEGLLNRQMFINAVDTIVGRKAKDLMTYQSESQTASESAKLEQVRQLRETVLADVPSNLMGGIRHGGAGSRATLSDDQKQYIKDMFKADGVPRDEKRLAAMQSGEVRTLEDYRRLNAQLKETS